MYLLTLPPNTTQAEVRERFPEAGYVEIVPDSSQNKHLAIEAFLNKSDVRDAEKYQVRAHATNTHKHTQHLSTHRTFLYTSSMQWSRHDQPQTSSHCSTLGGIFPRHT